MKFAIPLAQGVLCAHFGHSENFVIVDTQDGQIKSKELLTPPPHEPGVLPRWLQELGVNVVIAGGMGRRAQDLFNQNGIKVVVGAPSDEPESLIQNYLTGALVTGENLCDH
jgi:predicted Fe-Mo cluster-binding NifX family protein